MPVVELVLKSEAEELVSAVVRWRNTQNERDPETTIRKPSVDEKKNLHKL